MDLLDQIRAAREAERLALIPQPGFTDALEVETGVGMEGMMSAVFFEDQIAKMIEEANDSDLLRAYQRTNREPDNQDAAVLLAQIQGRGLDV